MKKLSAIVMTVLFFAFSACNKNEDVNPSTSSSDDASSPALAAKKASKTKALETPITGAIDGVPFSGIFRIEKFTEKGGQIFAEGHLTDLTGSASAPHVAKALGHKKLSIPVSFNPNTTAASGAVQAASCDILDLVLGPLHLDLLGLVIDLNQVVLTITGTTGAGDLLGNLLCAITGLLNPLGDLLTLLDLLNDLIDLIGTLGI
jgi:hypothetical protein